MAIQMIVSIIGASQGVFLSLLFFLRKKKHPAMITLGIYVFLFSIGLLESGYSREHAGILKQVFFSFIANANLLYGPLVYLFIRYLENQRLSQRLVWIHCSPFFLFFVADVLFILGAFVIDPQTGEVLDLLAFEVLVIQLLLYSFVSLRRFRRIRNNLLNTYSAINDGDLRWVLYLLYFITGIYVLSFAFTHLLLAGVISDESVFVVIQLMVALFTYLLGYRLFVRPAFFFIGRADGAIKNGNTRYQKSGLKSEEAETRLHELVNYMKSRKPFTNPELTIFDVAAAMQISRNHLTEILNVYGGKTFNEFINTYRVEEAKRLLREHASDTLSVSGIGRQAGFKSPNAFFTNFKKMTGQTPAAWKEQQSRS